jgi:hypothetical protein
VIAKLRRRHRVVFLALVVVVPVGLAVGLAARTPVPTMASDDPALAGLPGAPAAEAASADGLLAARRLEDGGTRIVLSGLGALSAPDVLVYLVQDASALRLPPDARLLGALRGVGRQAFDVGPGGLGDGSHVLLYSLGHQEIIGRAAVR